MGLIGLSRRESYRDLLRTAEEIIEMDRSAQKVESKLAEASRNCNWRLLEKKARNLRAFQERAGERGLYTDLMGGAQGERETGKEEERIKRLMMCVCVSWCQFRSREVYVCGAVGGASRLS